MLITSYSLSGGGDARVNLRVTIARDGSARMDGAILVVSALDGPMPLDDPGRTRRLAAQGTAAQASCADADGDGHSGIVHIAANLEDAHSGDPAPVVLETLPGQDIDEPGIYPLALAIGDERWTVYARVTLGPLRRRGKRRGRRRRR